MCKWCEQSGMRSPGSCQRPARVAEHMCERESLCSGEWVCPCLSRGGCINLRASGLHMRMRVCVCKAK